MEAIDIISYLEDKGITYATSGKNIGQGWLGISCPWCLDSSFHFGVNLVSKVGNCFRCGVKANAVALIAEIEHISKKQAYITTRKYLNLDVALESKNRVDVCVEHVELTSLTKKFPDTHTRYLEERNYDAQQIIKRFDLYAGTITGEFKFRIVAPVYLNGKIVSLVGRDITNKSDQRYKTLAVSKSKLPIKSTLYNFDTVDRDVVLVEGIFDCWRVGDSCAATLGTKTTADQILLLRGLRNVFILFDADAKTQAEHLATRIQGLVKHVEIILLSEGDPAELHESDVRALRRELRI